MKAKDAKEFQEALNTIYGICARNHEKKDGCVGCPANGKGKLCHHGEVSCCAPHNWWAFSK